MRTKIFVSYSHQDEIWLKRLQVHLGPIIRDGSVDFFADTQIRPGADWRREIQTAIASAKVVILLISADFLASEFVMTEELPRMLGAAEEEGAIILPIILSPSRFSTIPSLARFQTVNPPDRPLIKMEKWEQEEALVAASDAVLKVATPPSRDRVQPPGTSVAVKTPRVRKQSVVRAGGRPPRKPPVSPKILKIFDGLTGVLGSLNDSTWDELSSEEKAEYRDYLRYRLETDEKPIDAIRVLSHSNWQFVKPGPKLPEGDWKFGDTLRKLCLHPDADVRSKATWELRFHLDSSENDEPDLTLLSLLVDMEMEVVSNALGSLGFLAENREPARLRDVIEVANKLLTGGDDDLVDSTLFLFSKLIPKEYAQRFRSAMVVTVVRMLDSGSEKVRDRAIWCVSEVASFLTEEELSAALSKLTDKMASGDASKKTRVLRFYEDWINPRYNFRWNAKPPAGLIIERILDEAIAALDDEDSKVRYQALSTIARLGRYVPGSQHERVLARTIDFWEVDRGIPKSILSEIVDSYVGKIPDLLRVEVQGYLRERAEREAAERRRRESDE
jgi:hypothetical protein